MSWQSVNWFNFYNDIYSDLFRLFIKSPLIGVLLSLCVFVNVECVCLY